MGFGYRVAQFLRALASRLRPEDLALVDIYLPPTLVHLFQQMSPTDQAHGLRVLHNLILQNEQNPHLLAAALLHDVGKSRIQMRLWERVLIVMTTWLIPDAVQRWGTGAPAGWRRPFVVAAQHPAWGSEMIQQAGGAQELVALVRHHQKPSLSGSRNEFDRLLLLLQEADGLN